MKRNPNYIIGLDLGVSSVGWSLIELEPNGKDINFKRLIDAGVRIFETSLEPKTQLTLASIRRSHRSSRRRNRRRSLRIADLRELLFANNIKPDGLTVGQYDPYFLRFKALDNKLSSSELYYVLLHLSKRRGFKSNRKNLEKDEGGSGDDGKVLRETNEIILKYRTLGEALYLDPKFLNTQSVVNASENSLDSRRHNHKKRNSNQYHLIKFTRSQVEKEIKLILETQISKGFEINSEFINKFISRWGAQRSFFDEKQIEKLIGKCSIFVNEFRAPSNTIAYHRLRAFQTLNTLFIHKDGIYLSLINIQTGEKTTFKEFDYSDFLKEIDHNYISNFKEITSKDLLKLLKIDDYENIIIRGDKIVFEKNKENENTEDKEKKSKIERIKIVKKNQFLTDLRKVISDFYPDMLIKLNNYQIDCVFVETLSRFREEEKIYQTISQNLRELGIEFDKNNLEKLIENLPTTEKRGDLSLKALYEILPYIEVGIFTSEAIDKIKKKYGIQRKAIQHETLPPLNDNTLTNPRVKRTLSETRKVINGIIKKYGAPTFVNIELGRDLANSEETKKEIKSHNDKLEKKRNEAREILKSEFGIFSPSNTDIQRYMLWKSQNEYCMLSLEKITANELFSNTEIDHLIPWSRFPDDSYFNRILVKTRINQEKRNKTPFEYFGSNENSNEWKRFVNFVNSLEIAGKKKGRLTSKTIPEGFSNRDLNDTRYASRYIKNYIEENLKFKDADFDSRVIVVNGATTSILRKFYLNSVKVRNSDRHHAMDAIIVALANRSFIKKINDYSQKYKFGTDDFDKNIEEVRTKLPPPWEGYYDDIYNRVYVEGEEFEKYKNNPEVIKRYRDISGLVKPLFISRAPNRKSKGPAHAETVYSYIGENEFGKKQYTVRKFLDEKTKINEIISSKIYESDPAYKSKIKNLTTNDLKEISRGDYKIYKETISNKSRITSYKELIISNSTKEIPRGDSISHVESGRESIKRVDVFKKDDNYYYIPIYVYDTVKELPNMAIKKNKPKSEWTKVDETFEFIFSLQKNDLIRIKQKRDSDWVEGYYNTIDSSSARLKFDYIDGKKINDENFFRLGGTTLYAIEKYNVTPLGKKFKVKKEKRMSFNLNKKHKWRSET